jgi:hypothetical protein
MPYNKIRPYTPESSLRSLYCKNEQGKSTILKKNQNSKFEINLNQGKNIDSQKHSLRNSNLSLDLGANIENMSSREVFGFKLKKVDKDAEKFNK